MKTPEQWMDENDPAWQDVCGEQPVLTKEIIAAIQADASEEDQAKIKRLVDFVDRILWHGPIDHTTGRCYDNCSYCQWLRMKKEMGI